MSSVPRSVRLGETKLEYFPEINCFNILPFNQSIVDLLTRQGDGLLTSTTGSYPDAILLQVERAKREHVPIFVMNGGMWEEAGQQKVARTAIPLSIGLEQETLVKPALEMIISQQRATGINGTEGYNRIAERARRMFSSPQFPETTGYIELMINPDLKALADSLPEEAGPIVIDCGHIDSPDFRPTISDALTIEEGLVLQRYLRQLGHEAKVSILFNETYILDQDPPDIDQQIISRVTKPHLPLRYTVEDLEALRDKDPATVAKNDIRFQAIQAKRHAITYKVQKEYDHILRAWGIISDESRHENLQCELEGNLMHATRQDLRAAVEGDTTRFNRELNPDGRTYTVQPEAGEAYTREIATEKKRAPSCNLLSGKLNKKHQDRGFKTIIYLRDEETGGCGIRAGTKLGRELYGVTVPVHAVFYVEHRGKIDNYQPQKL